MADTVDVDRLSEYEDSEEVFRAKIKQLADMCRESKYTVFYTGAGVSTSAGVGDYRGPTGAWTMARLKKLRTKKATGGGGGEGKSGLSVVEEAELKRLIEEADKKNSEPQPKKVSMMDAQPTAAHMAQATMIRLGLAQVVVTTNLDGIYRKAGLRAHENLTCLHGDVYAERCTGCGREYERNYHVRQDHWHVHDHSTPAACAECGSQNTERKRVGPTDKNIGTKDTHINFGEYLDPMDWDEAEAHCVSADLCIIAGTSMSLRHITHFPFTARKTAMINLQETPDDEKCDLRIWGKCDPVFIALFDELGIELDPVPVWRPRHSLHIKSIPKWCHDYYHKAALRLEVMAKQREAEWKGRTPLVAMKAGEFKLAAPTTTTASTTATTTTVSGASSSSASSTSSSSFGSSASASTSSSGGGGAGASDVVHERSQCDECSVFPITGRRFKCTTCEDFDLCEACAIKGSTKHPADHNTVVQPKFRFKPTAAATTTAATAITTPPSSSSSSASDEVKAPAKTTVTTPIATTSTSAPAPAKTVASTPAPAKSGGASAPAKTVRR